jgi:hypothetical protein
MNVMARKGNTPEYVRRVQQESFEFWHRREVEKNFG